MIINTIVFPLIMFFYYIFSKSKRQNKKGQKKLIIACSIILLLESSLRSLSVGMDTTHYYLYFYESLDRSWANLLKGFFLRYETLVGDSVDYGALIFYKLIGTFFPEFHLFTFVGQSFFYIPFGIFMYRHVTNCKQILFAYILFASLFMGLPNANARQFYAIGFTVMSLLFFERRKYWKTAIALVLGMTIHLSALVVCVYYAIRLLPNKWINRLSILAIPAFFVSLVVGSAIIKSMGGFIGSEKYASYGNEVSGGALTYIVLSFAMCVFCMFVLKKYATTNISLKLLYPMIPITLFLVPLIYVDGSMLRVTMYFQIYFCLLTPMALEKQFNNDKNVFWFVLLGLMIVSIATGSPTYKFMWEEEQNVWLYYK